MNDTFADIIHRWLNKATISTAPTTTEEMADYLWSDPERYRLGKAPLPKDDRSAAPYHCWKCRRPYGEGYEYGDLCPDCSDDLWLWLASYAQLPVNYHTYRFYVQRFIEGILKWEGEEHDWVQAAEEFLDQWA